MNLLVALLLALTVIFSWFAQLIGLPGNWVIVAAAAAYHWWTPVDAPADLGLKTVVALLVLAVVGEVVEFAAGAAGVAKVGGSRRSALLALIGSVVGGVVGLFVGIPIPVIGSLVAALVFAAAGAMAGAFIGESWKGRDFDTSFEVGKAAFAGRVLGTLAKMIVCSIMVVVTLVALVL